MSSPLEFSSLAMPLLKLKVSLSPSVWARSCNYLDYRANSSLALRCIYLGVGWGMSLREGRRISSLERASEKEICC